MTAVREVITQQELERRIDAIKLCGANRGPHHYIPIAWTSKENELTKEMVERVSVLMCKVCFSRVSMQTIYEQFGEAKV